MHPGLAISISIQDSWLVQKSNFQLNYSKIDNVYVSSPDHSQNLKLSTLGNLFFFNKKKIKKKRKETMFNE